MLQYTGFLWKLAFKQPDANIPNCFQNALKITAGLKTLMKFWQPLLCTIKKSCLDAKKAELDSFCMLTRSLRLKTETDMLKYARHILN